MQTLSQISPSSPCSQTNSPSITATTTASLQPMQSTQSQILVLPPQDQQQADSGGFSAVSSENSIASTKTLQQQQQHVTQSSAIMRECQGCMCFIQDRYYLQVMEKAWHLNCLRCADCKFSLDSQQSCFSKDGFIYCKEDYFKWVSLAEGEIWFRGTRRPKKKKKIRTHRENTFSSRK